VYCRARGFLILASLVLASCAKNSSAPGKERIAILRFENLSPDVSLSWMGRAFSEIIGEELAGSPDMRVISSSRLHRYDRALGMRPVTAPGISTESPQALAAGATRIVYGDYTVRNGRLEVQVTIEDPRTLRMTQTFTVSALPGDVLRAATDVARHISPRIKPYVSQNPEAVAAYMQALETGDTTRMEMGLRAAGVPHTPGGVQAAIDYLAGNA